MTTSFELNEERIWKTTARK